FSNILPEVSHTYIVHVVRNNIRHVLIVRLRGQPHRPVPSVEIIIETKHSLPTLLCLQVTVNSSIIPSQFTIEWRLMIRAKRCTKYNISLPVRLPTCAQPR